MNLTSDRWVISSLRPVQFFYWCLCKTLLWLFPLFQKCERYEFGPQKAEYLIVARHNKQLLEILTYRHETQTVWYLDDLKLISTLWWFITPVELQRISICGIHSSKCIFLGIRNPLGNPSRFAFHSTWYGNSAKASNIPWSLSLSKVSVWTIEPIVK